MQQRMDNLPEKLTAHAVRRLRPCAHCKGIGDKDQMIHGERGHDDVITLHTRCYVEKYGFKAVLLLPLMERDKFRICDLTVSQMRKLMDNR